MDFVTTGDGSKTIYNAQIGENYHSKHGALQESKHVFLKTGLQFYLEKEKVKEVSVLEIGFGTGLNFIMTADYCLAENVKLNYCGIEAYPLEKSIIEGIGYNEFVCGDIWDSYITNYAAALENDVVLNSLISLKVAHTKLLAFETSRLFDVIYFDAFAAVHQPEMWSDETLAHVAKFLKPGGVFVTYAITGNLKRSMKALGFTIEKAPGAPGKREMLRAIKL
ncbi:tRNA (5-methylaminomethyl-2-thiouridine)(34)-methyltransferase MnmD [Sphingobacterium sp. WQ 366]|uniref:tRNA (5-methylaminomethyl-2-thiouridine)(34)-methyltransferase MnmD n=2 Tax=Sphingobacterium bovistauri TaxID=2781959 RepID=A0ABS7ZCR6_9SPHI|nr:tRNA (5-methylaminomethyl-2-thiouridine)(34)-methyltransferase MnmD [Sphingobacterium bovistauri]MCA5006524.1 tRNA (5-methylaminomethyl-2-thiouridine)(34)-methyltransferase MnmD [Sphingobacterium bovistauri]